MITAVCRPLYDDDSKEYNLDIPYKASVSLGSLEYRVSPLELMVNSANTLTVGSIEVTNNFVTPVLFLAAFTLDPAFKVVRRWVQQLQFVS